MTTSLRTLEYRLRYPAPWTHLVDVSLRIPSGGDVELWMPVWTPGSYLVREFSRHVQDLAAAGEDGTPLPVAKTGKNVWRVAAAAARSVTVTYRVYGREMTVRTNWIDGDFALQNGAATFLAVRGFETVPHRVTVDLPGSWSGAWCALPADPIVAGDSGDAGAADSRGRRLGFLASDLDELIDSPMLAGNPAVYEFAVDGASISLLNVGEDGLWDGAQAARDAEAIVRAYAAMMAGLPFDRYLFMNCIAESRGGLEHRKCSVLMTSRYTYRRRKAYLDWLGLVSHEFFHTWNVKRSRPVELGPFDYERENYTRGLWVAEGITSYYTDLVPRRAGLTTAEEYLGLLSTTIGKLQSTPGRSHQSLEAASFDAWIKHYRPDENTGNTTISYYTKGAVVAWLLDVEIRTGSRGAHSLDDLMRCLYQRYSGDRGFTGADVEREAEEIAGRPLGPFFADYVRGTRELDYAPALAALGLRFRPALEGLSDEAPPVWLGIETTALGDKLLVASVREDGPGYAAGLSAGDEILALRGFRVDARTFTERLHQLHPGERVDVWISRRDAVRIVPVEPVPNPGNPWRLELDPTAAPEAVRARDAWIGKAGTRDRP